MSKEYGAKFIQDLLKDYWSVLDKEMKDVSEKMMNTLSASFEEKDGDNLFPIKLRSLYWEIKRSVIYAEIYHLNRFIAEKVPELFTFEKGRPTPLEFPTDWR